MAVQEVTRLFRAAQVNPNLREQLNTAPDADTFVKMAREQGYEFTRPLAKVFCVKKIMCSKF